MYIPVVQAQVFHPDSQGVGWVQDAEYKSDLEVGREWGVVHLHRSEGCILPCTHIYRPLAFSLVCLLGSRPPST